MSKKWISFLVAAVVGTLVLAPAMASATCTIQVLNTLTVHDKTKGANVVDPTALTPGDAVDGLVLTNTGIAPPAPINAEGVVERLSDVLIQDSTGAVGATFCFNAGTVITISFNGVLTNPGVGSSLSTASNLDVYDSQGIGGLSISSATVSNAFSANTQQTIVTMKVGTPGTAAGDLLTNGVSGRTGAALRLKNLRLDATTVTGGNAVNAGLSQGAVSIGSVQVASKAATLAAISPVNNGAGKQSSGKGLTAQGFFSFQEGFASAFRVAATAAAPASNVANDIATVATSLVFTLTSIPSGVTVTFPSAISNSAFTGVAANSLTWSARSGTLTNNGAAGTFTVVYDTTSSGATANGFNVQIETADNADPGTGIGGATTSNPNCAVANGIAVSNNTVNSGLAGAPCDPNPKVGVKIGATSGNGQVNISAAFGRGDVNGALFTGDDVAADATVIPRYKGSARLIANNANFFNIQATRTVLLYPYVTNLAGFQTGLQVANSGLDTGAFTATNNQSGALLILFFNAVDGSTFSINTDASVPGSVPALGRNLDAGGRVKPGAIWADTLADLLAKAGKAAGYVFDGYVIVVTSFDYGHGTSVILDSGGRSVSGGNALNLGNGTVRGAAPEAVNQ